MISLDAGSESAMPLELWGGIECTVNRVDDGYHDQVELTGHGQRLDDLQRIAALGIRRVRYPVLWERVAREHPGQQHWDWLDRRLEELRSLGIAPIAGLVHHGSGPRYSTLLDEDFAARLADYARSVAQRFPWIDAYTPINEPLTTARFCALYGHWYPHAASDATFVRALLNECRATVLSMRAVREVNPAARLIQPDDIGTTFSTPTLAYQARFENHRRWLAWDLLFGRVDYEHPLWRYLRVSGASASELEWFLDNPCPPDVVGLNYYLTSDRFLDERVDRYAGVRPGGNGRHGYVDVEAVRACRAISGHLAVLNEAWLRYQQPVALTEVHLGSSREEQMRWVLEAWDAAHAARRAGANVCAVTAWALFGLVDWDSLVTRLNGHYEPGAYDVRGPHPRPTALAAMFADLSAGRDMTHFVFDSPGWWRRPERLHFNPSRDTYPAGVPPKTSSMRLVSRAPRGTILITGGGGTLGGAFARICGARGLRCEVLRRGDLDVTDRGAVVSALDRLQPWAVVNAAGYVRVDDAEGEGEQCRRVNTQAPQQLAEECARRGIRLVCFSSDLVFDGKGPVRPYYERDDPAPLSVYGRSKSDADRSVLAACPDALIARTSAFFGPWDEANLVRRAVAAFAAGQPWRAAYDQRVSPTYVPDLVNATLDLLIDGAAGLWHLTNEGNVSWAELARQAAVACGYSSDLVEGVPTAALHLRAARPPFSVLGTEKGQRLPPLEDALLRFVAECRLSATAPPQPQEVEHSLHGDDHTGLRMGA